MRKSLLLIILTLFLSSCLTSDQRLPIEVITQEATSSEFQTTVQTSSLHRHDTIELNPPCQPPLSVDPSSNRWMQIGPYGGTIRAIAFDPKNPERIYAGTAGSGIYRSDDGGDHWSPISYSDDHMYISSLVFDPRSPETLYAGTERPTEYHASPIVIRTHDQGKSWSTLTDLSELEFLVNEVTSLVFHPDGLYMGSMAIYTLQEGSRWTRLSEGWLGYGFIHISIDPNNSNKLYAGTKYGGLYRSVDGGRTWNSFGQETFTRSQSFVEVDPSDSSRLLASADGLFVSEDNGISWIQVLEEDITSIVFDPVTPDRVWATGPAGVRWSLDSGKSWSSVKEFEGVHVWVIAINPTVNTEIFVGTNNLGIFRSRDAGASWKAVSKGISNTTVSAVAVDDRNPQRVYAGTLGSGLYITENLGSSWQHPPGLLSSETVHDILIDPMMENYVYVGTWDGLFISKDAGNTWTRDHEFLDGMQVVSLASDPMKTRLYAGTFGDGLFVSLDSGIEWDALEGPDRYITDILVDPFSSQRIYAGTLRGIYRSDDGGKTWSNISEGIVDHNVRSLSVGSKSNMIYAATGDAIYVSEDAEAEWKRISDQIGPDYFRAVIGGAKIIASSWNGVFISAPPQYRWSSVIDALTNIQVNALAMTENSVYAGTHGGGVFLFKAVCSPLFGMIRDLSTGNPLVAEVFVEPGSYSTVTGHDGTFSFIYMPAGNYTISAMVPNQDKPTSRDINYSPGEAFRIDLEIPKGLFNNAIPVLVLGEPKRNNPQYSGGVLHLTAFVGLLDRPSPNTKLVWTSNLEGPLGETLLDENGVSHFQFRLHELGRHKIIATLEEDGHEIGQGFIEVDVIRPVLGTLGMAFDGTYLWASEERPGAELGNIYKLSIVGSQLSVVDSYTHPTPNPLAIAWDGTYLWTSGVEARDPYFVELGGRNFLYRHIINDGLLLIERYTPDQISGLIIDGLTWDGNNLWVGSGSHGRIAKIGTSNGLIEVILEFDAPSSQIHAIEWIEGKLWVLSSGTGNLYKLDPSTGQILVMCPIDSNALALAWDGELLWTQRTHGSFYSLNLSAVCPP